MPAYTATYSPDDNKLRLYAGARLPAEEYARVKAAGFRWAPKQDLFFATWSPAAEDLLLALAGEIEDEDKSLTERADERADRFGDYSDKRAHDAESAAAGVKRLADGIPLGQPILVGHHSERRARKDAAKIESGMRHAVKMWETAQYWKDRAAGALRHAKYKERPDVRARRIKVIEADKRRQEKYKAEAEKWQKLWSKDGLTLEQARALANYCRLTVTRTNADGTPNTNGGWSAYDVLRPDEERYQACPAKTLQDCIDAARTAYPRTIARCDRWIAHYDNRLAYERAMLADAGGTVAQRTGPEKGGAVRCWCSPGHGTGWSYIQKVNRVSVTVLDNWGNTNADGTPTRNFTRTIPTDKLKAVMTAAQVKEARGAGTLKETPDGLGFYLMQSREDFDAASPPKPEPEKPAHAADFQAIRETLKAGIQVVSAPQLFPTPHDLAQRMADEAGLAPGMRVLEPSAGTGAILNGLTVSPLDVVAVEINHSLADRLRETQGKNTRVHCADFLQCNGDLGTFDRILMNPPFADGADIKHIQHAIKFLKPGGRLVAICANGPRQRAQLVPLAARWDDLPPGTFKDSGTGVNTALLVVNV